VINFIIWLILGAIIGWLAGMVMGDREGTLLNIVVGIVGAFVGGFVFRLLGIGGSNINNNDFSLGGDCTAFADGPAGRARLSAVSVGAHTLTLEIRTDGVDIQHLSGPEALDLRYRLPAGDAAIKHTIAYGSPPELVSDDDGRWLRLLTPGQQINLRATPEHVYVDAPDRREEQTENGADMREPAVGEAVRG